VQSAVLSQLRCPVCADPLTGRATPPADRVAAGAPPGPPGGTDPPAGSAVVRALRCPRGHSFDLARQGYVNLLAGRAPHVGDTAEMVADRVEFLATGHYDVIAAALVEAAARVAPPAGVEPALVVDAGAGTGWYLGRVLDALPGSVGLALDVSKPALRRAARAHSRAAAALADTWRPLPLADAGVALLLNVFAPRNGPEFHRVLHPEGALLVVTPTEEHLGELVGPLGLLRVDPTKEERVAERLADRFDVERTTRQHTLLTLTRPQLRTLVGMGPSARHTDPGRLAERVAALPEPVTVTVATRLTVHRPR